MAYYRGITNVVHLQLHKNNYFNIAKARRERTRSRGNASVRVPGRKIARGEELWDVGGSEAAASQESTSEREYEVDA